MKHTILSLALLPLFACAEHGEADPQRSSSPTAEADSSVLAGAERRLEELEDEVSDIRELVAEETTKHTPELDAMLAAIDEKRQAVIEEIVALEEGGERNLERPNESLQEALHDLERAIDDAWNRIRA